MIIYRDPDEWVTEIEHGPNISIDPLGYCGSTIYKFRRATPEEYRKNRYKRLLAEKRELEERIDLISLELEGGT